MIFDILTWIYISVICYAWGKFFFVRLIKSPGLNWNPGFPVTSFLGLCLLGILTMYFSLFFSVNEWLMLGISLPALLFYRLSENRKSFKTDLKNLWVHTTVVDRVLVIVTVFVLLLLNSAAVIHPDTLNYHNDSVQIYKRFGQIPGIANVKLEYGFQSLWFAVLALFDFSIFESGMSYPLAGAVMCWFVLYLISSASKWLSHKQYLWYLFLFLAGMLAWTQIRLTASSASPDFIVAVCIFLSLYFFIKTPDGESYAHLSVFFSMAAVCVKLSAVPVLIVPLYFFIRAILNKDIKTVSGYMKVVVLFLAPLMIRNLISSGYPLYPSTVADVFPFEWKLRLHNLIHFQHYITTYARYPVLFDSADSVFNQRFFNWLPVWFNHRYIADKMILLSVLPGLFLSVIFYRQWVSRTNRYFIIATLISLTGTVFWFVNAPDPRFGTGFLLSLIYFLYVPFFNAKLSTSPVLDSGLVPGLKWISAFFILCYTGYRCVYFFRPDQILIPEGIQVHAKMKTDCNSQFKQMLFTGGQPADLISDSCKKFQFRTGLLKDGFKPDD
jgi:hypothetical protein